MPYCAPAARPFVQRNLYWGWREKLTFRNLVSLSTHTTCPQSAAQQLSSTPNIPSPLYENERSRSAVGHDGAKLFLIGNCAAVVLHPKYRLRCTKTREAGALPLGSCPPPPISITQQAKQSLSPSGELKNIPLI